MTRGKKNDGDGPEDEATTGGTEQPATSGNAGLSEDAFAESRALVEADDEAKEQWAKDHTLGEYQPVITTAEMKSEAKYAGRSREEAEAEDAAAVPAGVSGEPPESTEGDGDGGSDDS